MFTIAVLITLSKHTIPQRLYTKEALLIIDEVTASHNVSWRLWCDLDTDHVVLPKSMVIL